MKTLMALVERDGFPVPAFSLDHFQRKVREGLHLEFFLARGRLLVTPHLAALVTTEATAEEQEAVRGVLEEKQEVLEELKLYLLYNLSLHSALLETNSHHVAVNEHRVISRFLPHGPGACEVKLYTQPPGDPVARYGDRIYLGRDLLPLDAPRPHLGLAYIRQSLPEQVARLEARLERNATAAERDLLGEEFLPDLREILDEFVGKADAVLAAYPADISSRSLPRERLLEVNRDFRELKHVLAEAEIAVREAEERLLADGSDVARYLTKLRKDLTNDVNFVMIKVNGRISDAVNDIHV